MLLPHTRPWYVDTRTGEIGPLEIDLPSDLLQVLSEAPPVPATVANLVRRNLERKLTAQSSFLPQDFGPTASRDIAPTLCLRLVVQVGGQCSPEENDNVDEDMCDGEDDDLDEIGDEYVEEGVNVTLLAYPTFDYGSTSFSPDDPRKELISFLDGSVEVMRRQPAAELAGYSRLKELGFRSATENPATFPLVYAPDSDSCTDGDPQSLEYIYRFVVPELQAAGWKVTFDGDPV